MKIIYPKPLQLGDTVGLITPSSPMQEGRVELGERYLNQHGFKVKVGRFVHQANRFMAGTDSERAQDVMDFFCDKEIKAIMAIAGGYGSQRILPLLDMQKIRENPKWLTGFSDTTALQLGLLSQSGIASCSGFTFRDLDGHPPDPLIEQTLMACLFGKSYDISEGTPLTPGIATGPLVGGNLGCINALIGTPFQPQFKHSILLIEEVWAEPFKIDSMLSQLELCGVFQQISGLIWGQFEQCIPEHQPERDGSVDDIIDEWTKRISVPSIKNFPYGHVDRRCVLPFGVEVMLNADLGKLTVRL